MPKEGWCLKLWRHVIVNTRCSWFHGDERGFRSRDHRVHSSGDYKHRPPIDEHEHLRWYHQSRSGDAVSLDLVCRVVAVREFVLKVRSLGHRIIACSCGGEHLHALVELPPDREEVKREIGKAKQKVSHTLRDVLPGSIWSEGGEYKPVNDSDHLRNVYDYIRTKQELGTVVWSHAEGEDWLPTPTARVLIVGGGRSLAWTVPNFEAHPGLREYAQTPA